MDLNKENPAARAGANRAYGDGGKANILNPQLTETNSRKQEKFLLNVHVLDGDTLSFEGRVAWALDQLIKAGKSGCTPITHPGPRWSAYVLKLRRAGLIVETIYERHGGPFSGNHARYVLRTPVTVIGGGD